MAAHRHSRSERRQGPALVRRRTDARARRRCSNASPRRKPASTPARSKSICRSKIIARVRAARSAPAARSSPRPESRSSASIETKNWPTVKATAKVACGLRRHVERRIARLADRKSARRPQRAALDRLSQGERRNPRPDRPHHDRRIVRQSTPTAGWKACSISRLPQDASISGFGMWIGNDLVEADVVEKQRAREIYETILREKRRSGLAGMDRRQYLQSPRVSDRAQFRKAGQNRLYASAAAAGDQISLHLRAAERNAADQAAPRAVAHRDGQLGPAAQERHLSDAFGPHQSHRSLGPGRVHRPGIHAEPRFRGRSPRSTAGSRM